MSEKETLFRKVSLERLSSPEQLDQKLTVISPIGWLALSSLLVMILAALSWGIFGKISNKLAGNGMLLFGDGMVNLIASADGQITDISAQNGDYVEKGQTIARVSQGALLLRLEALQDDMRALDAVSTDTWSVDANAVNLNIYQEFSPLANQIKLNAYDDELKSLFAETKLLKQKDLEIEIGLLRRELEHSGLITANASGTVMNINFQRGDLLQMGETLCSIVRDTRASENVNAILYLPIEQGKLATEGMEVDITPSTVNREEYGYIMGFVKSVSNYAVSQESVMTTLNNQQLVQSFLSAGAVLEVQVELLRDANTASGYKWSTTKGAPFLIEPGTICAGEIRVSSDRPIEKVMPFLKGII